MARSQLTVDELQKFIGEEVHDPYGRTIGKLVSLESDVDGTVQNIVVESESRNIQFIPSESVRITDGRITVWPEWKTMAYKILANYQRALKRLRGLEDMYSRNEIPSQIYRELRRRLDKSLEALKEEAKKLKEMIERRKNNIEDDNLKLERAIANLKISYLAGEIPEKYYKTAIEHLRNAKDSNVHELEELNKTKSRLESLESGVIEFTSKKEEHEAQAHPAAVPEQQPIPVKLIGG